jgi:quinol monooxygenase YgiN
MFIVHVDVHVKPDCIEAFKAATLANARASVREEGIARFDVIQLADDPSRFTLVEVYRSEEAPEDTSRPTTTRPGPGPSRR